MVSTVVGPPTSPHFFSGPSTDPALLTYLPTPLPLFDCVFSLSSLQTPSPLFGRSHPRRPLSPPPPPVPPRCPSLPRRGVLCFNPPDCPRQDPDPLPLLYPLHHPDSSHHPKEEVGWTSLFLPFFLCLILYLSLSVPLGGSSLSLSLPLSVPLVCLSLGTLLSHPRASLPFSLFSPLVHRLGRSSRSPRTLVDGLWDDGGRGEPTERLEGVGDPRTRPTQTPKAASASTPLTSPSVSWWSTRTSPLSSSRTHAPGLLSVSKSPDLPCVSPSEGPRKHECPPPTGPAPTPDPRSLIRHHPRRIPPPSPRSLTPDVTPVVPSTPDSKSDSDSLPRYRPRPHPSRPPSPRE